MFYLQQVVQTAAGCVGGRVEVLRGVNQAVTVIESARKNAKCVKVLYRLILTVMVLQRIKKTACFTHLGVSTLLIQ